ncbi:MAG: glycosyltransferase family 9 protein [Bacteroides sp.]|nr:glycosyltransferase family 9 protein [Bacteroides sp.]MCM1379070.1 glycosyltransferase family 9 protein [Bacteroides sp.]MCM1445768.1 glycosyltransferase family 9 protein [Prevotella sp.]
MPNLLIFRLSALGDVAMTIPVIYSVAKQYPDLQLTVVTRPFFRRIFINPPANISFIDFNAKTLRELFVFIKALKAKQYSAVADLHDVIRTRVIRYALRLRSLPMASVNKDRRARKRLTNDKERTFQRNYVDRYADVFASLGYPVNVDFKGFGAPQDQRAGVGLAPFARYQTKTYPPELMEEVARELTDRNIPVYLFGARGAEEEQLSEWVQRNPKLTLMAGKLPLEEELQAIGRLKLMVSMDSANMHLASLMGTPVVSIWGSTIPQCGFLGYGQSADNAIWLDLECQPCSVAGLPECPIGHYACLERLSPQSITKKILQLLITNY